MKDSEGVFMESNQTKQGILFIMSSYLIWGLFPLFWKLLEHVPSIEILWNRIVWSFIFTFLFIILIRKKDAFFDDVKFLINHPKQLINIAGASVVITVNWYIYIWAVNHEQVLQTSLGYYINPLLTVICGVIFFKEKLNRATIIAVCIAAIGVVTLTVYYGQMPYIALLLALTFAIYGVLKKKVTIEATRGLAIETFIVFPIGVIALLSLGTNYQLMFFSGDITTVILLMMSGILTALPLVLFAKGATKIPLYLVGFIQYLSPTIVLLLGVFLYNEPFSTVEFISFCFIWFAVFLFTVSKMLESRKSA